MDFKKFSIQVIIRVLNILTLTLIISYFYFTQDRIQLIFTFLVIICLLIFAVIEMIWFVSKTNRELSKFILSIKYSDFSVYFPEENKKGYLSELYHSFNQIIDSFKELSSGKHLQNELLQLIISQVKLGIMCTNEKNEIVLMNRAAENILDVFKTKTWHQLCKKADSFTSKIDNLSQGGNNIIDFKNSSESKQLFIQVGHCRLFDKPHRIITFHDIRQEIEQKESEAWIRLIRILNHEIMNSVTPISSLSETILMILGSEKEYENWEHLDDANFLDVVSSVRTIQNRSEGLFNFVTEYRKLTKIPSPKKEDVLISELLGNVEQLWKPEIEKTQIKFSIQLQEENLMIKVDPTLIEQVLINLVKNSIQALEKTSKPELQILAFKTDDSINILIKDNGIGIAPAIAKDIFVPFYTTKEKGSGIGLSLSRQIMRLHGGIIRVESVQNKITTFTLGFRNSQDSKVGL